MEPLRKLSSAVLLRHQSTGDIATVVTEMLYGDAVSLNVEMEAVNRLLTQRDTSDLGGILVGEQVPLSREQGARALVVLVTQLRPSLIVQHHPRVDALLKTKHAVFFLALRAAVLLPNASTVISKCDVMLLLCMLQVVKCSESVLLSKRLSLSKLIHELFLNNLHASTSFVLCDS